MAKKESVEEKINLFQRILRRKKLIIILLILILGIGLYLGVIRKRNGKIESVKIAKGTVEEELVLSGEINADEYAKLSFPTSGEIAWVGVREGDLVKKGQALTKLNTVVLNTIFQQSRATLRAAEATVENVHDQVKDHSGDETYAQKDSRTTAEATKDKAYEAYVAAEYNLRNSTITSPFTGIVTYLAHPFVGVNVLVTETQVEVINPESIYFDVTADQTEVVDISKGQKVNIVFDSISDRDFEGTVDFISYSPKTGEVGTVYKIKVKFDENNFDSKIYKIGMTGDAKFVLSKKDNVLYLPPKFVNSDAQGKYVNLSSKNNKTYVEVGIEGEDRIEIISDKVKEGDTVFD